MTDARNILNAAVSLYLGFAASVQAAPAAGSSSWEPAPALRSFTLPASIEHDAFDGLGDEPILAPGDDVPAQTLARVLEKYGELTHVPYVWGGSAIGNPSECQACKDCIAKKGRSIRVERRLKSCPACTKCGMDCSHFVHRIYKDAGLGFPYASTRELQRTSHAKLRERFGLVDVGRDLRRAQPGDLLLHPKHVVILLRVRGERTGDILHVSRSIEKSGRIGGVEILRNIDLLRFRGKLLKILRHERLDGVPPPPATVQVPPELA